jgi:hypothetical protein
MLTYNLGRDNSLMYVSSGISLNGEVRVDRHSVDAYRLPE